ncbi:hypothetical protein ACX0FG_15990, partial [Enterococcus faecium]
CFQGLWRITAVTAGPSGGAPGPALGFGMQCSFMANIPAWGRSVSSASGAEGSELTRSLDGLRL